MESEILNIIKDNIKNAKFEYEDEKLSGNIRFDKGTIFNSLDISLSEQYNDKLLDFTRAKESLNKYGISFFHGRTGEAINLDLNKFLSNLDTINTIFNSNVEPPSKDSVVSQIALARLIVLRNSQDGNNIPPTSAKRKYEVDTSKDNKKFNEAMKTKGMPKYERIEHITAKRESEINNIISKIEKNPGEAVEILKVVRDNKKEYPGLHAHRNKLHGKLGGYPDSLKELIKITRECEGLNVPGLAERTEKRKDSVAPTKS